MLNPGRPIICGVCGLAIGLALHMCALEGPLHGDRPHDAVAAPVIGLYIDQLPATDHTHEEHDRNAGTSDPLYYLSSGGGLSVDASSGSARRRPFLRQYPGVRIAGLYYHGGSLDPVLDPPNDEPDEV